MYCYKGVKMTDKEIQDYRDSIRYLLRVYLVTTMTTISEFAGVIGIHHKTMVDFCQGARSTKLAHVNKVEEYLRSKFPNADDLIQEGLERKEHL